MNKNKHLYSFDNVLEYIASFGLLEYLKKYHTPIFPTPGTAEEADGIHSNVVRSDLKRLLPEMAEKIKLWEVLHNIKITSDETNSKFYLEENDVKKWVKIIKENNA
jgi:hypothetical protein